jgi:hypothetical protein
LVNEGVEMDTDKLMTAEEAAPLIGIEVGTLRNAMTEGRIEVVNKFGRRLLTPEAVAAYKARTQPDGEIKKGRPTGSRDRTPRRKGEQA